MMEIFLHSAEVKDVICGNSDMLKTFKNNFLFQKCEWTFIHVNTCLSNLASSRIYVLGLFKLCVNNTLLTQQDYKSLECSNKISFGSW